MNRPIWAAGTMSGTSLDGVDAAMVLTDGLTLHDFGDTAYRPYSDAERAVLRAALGRWPGEDLGAALTVVQTAHAEVLSGLTGVAVAGFHGQTLAHEPHGRGTHQLADGDALARAIAMPVVWDFRSADVALGGQGAPLAPFFHHACARHIGAPKPTAFLNLGGVGNLTWVDPRIPDPAATGACLAFDTGPANAPIDDLVQARTGRTHDKGGALAAQGRVDEALVAHMLCTPYFRRMPPKSLDRSDFSFAVDAVAAHSDADAAATLTALAAAAVMHGLEHCPLPPSRLLVAGGGRHNAVLMRMLRAALPCVVDPVEDAGLDGDMLEAQAFAFLAVRVMRGLPTSAPGTTGVAAAVGGGQIAHP